MYSRHNQVRRLDNRLTTMPSSSTDEGSRLLEPALKATNAKTTIDAYNQDSAHQKTSMGDGFTRRGL